MTEFDSEYTTALKIADASQVLVSHVRRLPDGEFQVWDNEFLSEPYSDTWLDLQYNYLAPLYPDVPAQEYVWYLMDTWDELDHGLYETLNDALPTINAFFSSHGQGEVATLQVLQKDHANRASTEARMLDAQAQEVQTLVYYQEYLATLPPYSSSELELSSEQYTLNFSIQDVWGTVQHASTSVAMPWVLTTGVQSLDEPVLRTVERVPPDAMALLPKAPLSPHRLWFAVAQERGYLVVELDLDKGTSTVEISTGIDAFQAQIAELLPGVHWGVPKRLRVRGEYVLKDLTLSEFALADLVTSDPLMSGYLSLNENDPAPFRGKNRFGALWNKSRFILYFKQLKGDTTALHALFNQSIAGINDPYGMAPGTQYVRVSILKASSDDSARLFYAVFNRLVTYYTQQAPAVLEEYQTILGPGQTGNLEMRKSERVARQDDQVTRNDRLRMSIPSIFVDNYARVCQAQFQPEIVLRDEDAPDGKQVLRYPAPPNDQIQLVCPDNAPYPTLIQNTLKSKDVVGYLPCCTSTNQIDNPSSSYTKIYKEGKTAEEAFPPVRTRAVLQSEERVLSYDRPGKLPLAISAVVQSATAARLGSWNSPSSLLVALLQTQNAVPTTLTDASLNAMRRALPLTHPEVLSQEMWDVPADERGTWFRDPTRFMDPQLFLRAFEHIYDINIYLFSSEENFPVVLLPRYYQFPCRPFRQRSCALIYVHRDEERCELIVDGEKRLWDEAMNLRIYSLNEALCRTELRTETGVSIDPQNVYPWHQHTSQATHQILDPYGKIQGLVFQTSGLTMLGPPGAPLPLPAWPLSEPYPTSGTAEQVYEYMGRRPTRTLPTALEYDYARGVRMRWLLRPTSRSPLDVLLTQQTITALLLQCTNLLFYLSNDGDLNEDAVVPWVTLSCVVMPGVDYVPVIHSPYLPTLRTEDEARTHLESLLPSFFYNGKLALPSIEFRTRLIQHLRRFVRMYRAEATVTPNVLLGVPLHLPVTTKDALWIGPEIEVARARTRPTDAEVVTSLPQALLDRGQPVVMRQDGRLFLIVPNYPDIDTALVVADNWRVDGRVLPFGLRPVPTDYVTLELTDVRTWKIKERIGTDSTLMVLRYGRLWAAVLPL